MIRVRWLARAAALMIAVLPLIGISPLSAAAKPLRLSDTLVSALPAIPVSEVRQANGWVSDTWDVAGTPVTATGPAHVSVSVTRTARFGRHQLEVSMALPSFNKLAPLARPDIAGDTIWATPCVSASPTGGYWKACDIIYMIQQNSDGNWYLGDSEEISGYEDWPWELYELTVDNNWHSGNTVVYWEPTAGVPVGSCEQTTVGVDYIASISSTFTTCPQAYGPYSRTKKITTDFGGYWIDTSGTNGWQGAGAADIVHSPPDVSTGYTLTGYSDYSFL